MTFTDYEIQMRNGNVCALLFINTGRGYIRLHGAGIGEDKDVKLYLPCIL